MDKEVLVIGLGNRHGDTRCSGTAYVADNLNITRHIVKEYGKYAALEEMRLCGQCHSSRSDGTDRNGNSGDYKGCGEGDQARSL